MNTRQIIVKNNEELTLTINSFERLDIDVKNNGKLKINILKTDTSNGAEINANLAKDAQFTVIFADFGKTEFNLKGNILLNGIHANCEWRLATLASQNCIKTFDVSFIHNAEETTAKMINYGVSKDESKIFFKGVNHIKKTALRSDTYQSAKIITLDAKSMGHASPALRIDCDDVKAAHAASVGQMSDEHLFYLMSRGLSRDEARKLITIGYLKPISNYFEKNDRDAIINAIEEAV